MTDDRELSYEKLVEQALRGVVRDALKAVEDQGLPGDHHFYITFHSNYQGVELPAYLLEDYPEEMTIVLQHRFWNLTVRDEGFSVSLSFKGKPEQLVIPFAAIVSFADPSVQFVLQFEPLTRPEDPGVIDQDMPGVTPLPVGKEEPAASLDESAQVVALDSFRRKQ